MKRVVSSKVIVLMLGIGLAPTSALSQDAKSTAAQGTKGKICRMEQQCHWENFKKICTYVKVCR